VSRHLRNDHRNAGTSHTPNQRFDGHRVDLASIDDLHQAYKPTTIIVEARALARV